MAEKEQMSIPETYEKEDMNQWKEIKEPECRKPSSSKNKNKNHRRKEDVSRSRSRQKQSKTGDTSKVMEPQSMCPKVETIIPILSSTMEAPLDLNSILDTLCPLDPTPEVFSGNIDVPVPTPFLDALSKQPMKTLDSSSKTLDFVLEKQAVPQTQMPEPSRSILPTTTIITSSDTLMTTAQARIPCEVAPNAIHFSFDPNVYLGDLFDSIIAPTFPQQTQIIRLLHLKFYRRLVIDASIQLMSQQEPYPTPEQYLTTFIDVLTNVGLLTSLPQTITSSC